MRVARELEKRNNFINNEILPEHKIQNIESAMPSNKTTRSDRLLEYIQYVHDKSALLIEFYNQSFSRIRFWSYVGKQKALAEVSQSIIK